MSKRAFGQHPRRERDFYPTPFLAVPPLIPHLRREGIRSFVEPCCGERDLVRHLEYFGLTCSAASDLAEGRDALAIERFDTPIITNPPYDPRPRPLMHALVAHFARAAPVAWLLLESDWKETAQAARYLDCCSDAVAVGRLKTMGEHTASKGFDNFTWLRFDRQHRGGPRLHPLQRLRLPRNGRFCRDCAEPFKPTRADGFYCSNACRQRAYRGRLKP